MNEAKRLPNPQRDIPQIKSIRVIFHGQFASME